MSLNPIFAVSTQNAGGSQSKLNQNATLQVKNSKGVLRRVTVTTAGSGGSLVLNDLQAGGSATAANQVASIPNASLPAGLPVSIDLPFSNGIMVSAIPTGSVLNYFFD